MDFYHNAMGDADCIKVHRAVGAVAGEVEVWSPSQPCALSPSPGDPSPYPLTSEYDPITGLNGDRCR